jgi:hypothetical protein
MTASIECSGIGVYIDKLRNSLNSGKHEKEADMATNDDPYRQQPLDDATRTEHNVLALLMLSYIYARRTTFVLEEGPREDRGILTTQFWLRKTEEIESQLLLVSTGDGHVPMSRSRNGGSEHSARFCLIHRGTVTPIAEPATWRGLSHTALMTSLPSLYRSLSHFDAGLVTPEIFLRMLLGALLL